MTKFYQQKMVNGGRKVKMGELWKSILSRSTHTLWVKVKQKSFCPTTVCWAGTHSSLSLWRRDDPSLDWYPPEIQQPPGLEPKLSSPSSTLSLSLWPQSKQPFWPCWTQSLLLYTWSKENALCHHCSPHTHTFAFFNVRYWSLTNLTFQCVF